MRTLINNGGLILSPVLSAASFPEDEDEEEGCFHISPGCFYEVFMKLV